MEKEVFSGEICQSKVVGAGECGKGPVFMGQSCLSKILQSGEEEEHGHREHLVSGCSIISSSGPGHVNLPLL